MHSVGQAELAAFDAGSQWVTTDYKAGDLLVFSMHTMHGAVTNTATAQLRLSADIRFQPRSHAVDNRYTAHGPEWAVRTTRFNFHHAVLRHLNQPSTADFAKTCSGQID
jgi:ectoine hydroxylase-related dioxygenase (phytanoyl-CoA dioxygenase family)